LSFFNRIYSQKEGRASGLADVFLNHATATAPLVQSII